MSYFKKLSFISVFLCLTMQLQGCDQQKSDKAQVEKDKKANTSVYSREMLENIEKDVNRALQQSIDRTEAAVDGQK